MPTCRVACHGEFLLIDITLLGGVYYSYVHDSRFVLHTRTAHPDRTRAPSAGPTITHLTNHRVRNLRAKFSRCVSRRSRAGEGGPGHDLRSLRCHPHLAGHSPAPRGRPRTHRMLNILVLPTIAALASSSASIAAQLSVLRRCAASDRGARPSLGDATVALSRVANAGVHPPSWEPALCEKNWRPIFSAKPDALKAAAAAEELITQGCDDAARLPSSVGRYLTLSAQQRFTSNGQVANTVRLLWGTIGLTFSGSFTMSGRRMEITLETLRVKIFGFLRFTLDIREGRGLRTFIEKRLRGMRRSTNSKQRTKRPNEYRWCFADDTLCVAQGTSGSVAVWAAEEFVG